MKKLLITLLAMSSLSAYAAEISFSAELNAGAKILNALESKAVAGATGIDHRSYLRIVSPSVGASYEVTRNQILSVNLGTAYLGNESEELRTSKDIDQYVLGDMDAAGFVKLEIEYSFMVFEKNGFELSIAPSFVAFFFGDRRLGAEVNLAVSLQKNIMSNLYAQLEFAGGTYISDRTVGLKTLLPLQLQPTAGLKWMF